MTRIALAAVLGAALLITPGSAQTGAVTPKFEVVGETRLLMEGLAGSNHKSLMKLLKTKPADNDTWVFARGQAILIAETGNLLLLRPPRNSGRDAWNRLAMGMRSEASALARATSARDHPTSRSALGRLTAACNRCHTTFRVPVKVGPEDVPTERDAE
ncbi:MAG: cytochrome c [Gemmataceae bacterium]